jgi:hypothetical protein
MKTEQDEVDFIESCIKDNKERYGVGVERFCGAIYKNECKARAQMPTKELPMCKSLVL